VRLFQAARKPNTQLQHHDGLVVGVFLLAQDGDLVASLAVHLDSPQRSIWLPGGLIPVSGARCVRQAWRARDKGRNHAFSCTDSNSTYNTNITLSCPFEWKEEALHSQRLELSLRRGSGEAVTMSQQASSSLDRIVLDLRSK
jgi:hypothetical protein